MAKTETTVRGYVYTVTSPNGGTVTDAEGKLNKPVDAGDQVTVTAPSDSLTCDDDDAVICKANFKSPLLALRLLGQGGNALPAGYTRLAFLESTGTQYIDTGVGLTDSSVVSSRFRVLKNHKYGFIFGARAAANVRAFCIYLDANNTWLNYGSQSDKTSSPRLTNGVDYAFRASANVWTLNTETVVLKPEPAFNAGGPCYVFNMCANGAEDARYFVGRVYHFNVATGNEKRHLLPAIDANGTPCMFDTVSKQTFRNAGSGQFVAGVGTVAQLTALLLHLPATGGALTLALPAEANTPEVADMLQACHDTKSWTLTVHEYRPAEAATYSLRRVRNVVWCRRELSDQGSYVDADGFRWQIDRCVAIFGALGQDPAAYCYTPFDSVEQAAEFWEMQPYVDTEAMDDIMGDNGTLEQGGTENTSPTTNS